MSSVKLVRTYAETLLSNIHEYIVNDVSKLVKNKIVNGIEKLYQLGFIENVNQTVEVDDNDNDNQTVPMIEYVDDVIEDVVDNVVNSFENKTFDSFVDTVSSNEQYNINTLQELYNNYLNTNISTQKLSKMISSYATPKRISNCGKITKTRKMIDNKKITVYMIKQ